MPSFSGANRCCSFQGGHLPRFACVELEAVMTSCRASRTAWRPTASITMSCGMPETWWHVSKNHPGMPRELTYPTWGKETSSSKVPLVGDMFVPSWVFFEMNTLPETNSSLPLKRWRASEKERISFESHQFSGVSWLLVSRMLSMNVPKSKSWYLLSLGNWEWGPNFLADNIPGWL